MTKAAFPLGAGEQVIGCWQGGRVGDVLVHAGRVWLTNQRLVFQPVVLWVFWIAPLVGLVLWILAKGQWRYLALADIVSAERTAGRAANVLTITTRHGAHALVIHDYDAFASAFAQQRKAA